MCPCLESFLFILLMTQCGFYLFFNLKYFFGSGKLSPVISLNIASFLICLFHSSGVSTRNILNCSLSFLHVFENLVHIYFISYFSMLFAVIFFGFSPLILFSVVSFYLFKWAHFLFLFFVSFVCLLWTYFHFLSSYAVLFQIQLFLFHTLLLFVRHLYFFPFVTTLKIFSAVLSPCPENLITNIAVWLQSL